MPVTYLLFLEKQLADLHTFVKKLPVLDAAESWALDASTDCWATEPVQTLRTKKVPRNHVKAEATEKHPAQVEVYYEDVRIGYWTQTKFSGAPARQARQRAARAGGEAAAGGEVRPRGGQPTETSDQRVGEAVFGYLFASTARRRIIRWRAVSRQGKLAVERKLN